MSNFEQAQAPPQRSKDRAGITGASQDSSGIASFQDKKSAMRALLWAIVRQRAEIGPYRNPWAGMEESRLETYTNRVIDRLQKIRERDLSVAHAIYLEGQEAEMEPGKRLDALNDALKIARERSGKLEGAAKRSNKRYQTALERDISIAALASKNRAGLIGHDEGIEHSSMTTLLLDSGERPGYARIYMTVFAPSSTDDRKDLQLDPAGKIVSRSNRLWLNVGSPARALSYLHNYAMKSSPDAIPNPVIRKMSFPISGLKTHFSQAITEDKRLKKAIEDGVRTEVVSRINRRQGKVTAERHAPLENTDHKFFNQFGLSVDPGRFVLSVDKAMYDLESPEARSEAERSLRARISSKEFQDKAYPRKPPTGKPEQEFAFRVPIYGRTYRALFEKIDHSSFETVFDPVLYGDLYDPKVDGKGRTVQSLAESIGLGSLDDPVTVHLLRGGTHAATLFSLRREGDKWDSPSNNELKEIVDEASDLFDRLDRLPDNDEFGEQGVGDVGAGLAQRLGDLLDANRLTPGGLLSPTERLQGQLRDRYGNAAVKTALENALADRYLESDMWRCEMPNWSDSLANYIRTQLDDGQRNKLYENSNVKRDMHALKEGQSEGEPRNAVEALDAWSEHLRENSPVGAAMPERQIALFFHLLRALYPFVPEGQRATLEGKSFAVNNRIEEAAAFEVMNPARGPYGWGADRMESTKRFKPDPDKYETKLMQELDAPFLGGVSGTTRDINRMMKAVFGELNPDAFWRFQLLNASFMVKSRYHSMFETLYPASFFDSNRGEAMRERWQALRKAAPSNHRDLYEGALNVALGGQGQALWRAAIESAVRNQATASGE